MDLQKCCVILLLVLISTEKALGYSAGAPASTCLTMFPKHSHTESQLSQSPFKIKLSDTHYVPAQIINISLSADDQRTFSGIQIRAHRESGDVEEILGTFVYFPENKTKAHNCLGKKQNLVTHKTNERVTEVKLTWKAPDENVGNILFVATIVDSYKVFWVNIEQKLIASVSLQPPPVEKVTSSQTTIKFEECGKTFGCFLYPKYCSGADCDAGITYKSENDDVTIQAFAKAEGYVSVGFSHDRIMGGDQTISCTAEGDRVTIQHGFNPALFNDRQTVSGRLRQMQTNQIDGKIYCTFTRPKSMDVLDFRAPNGTSTFDLNDDFYLMVAWGYTYIGTDVMGKHDELPATTLSKVNFREYIIHRGESLPLLTQVHGILMLIAWILFGGITTVIARHYKNAMDRMFLGSKLWFQVHRAMAIMTFTLTAVSFVIIFVKVDGFTNDAEIHAYVGIAVMSASVLQLLGGLLRPNPKSKIRPAFNWGHWFLGKCTHLLSALAFFFAFNSPIIPGTQKLFGTIVIAVWLGLQVLWEIIFEIRKCRNTGGKSEKYDVSAKSDGSTGGSTSDVVLFTLYLITMLKMVALAAMSVFFF